MCVFLLICMCNKNRKMKYFAQIILIKLTLIFLKINYFRLTSFGFSECNEKIKRTYALWHISALDLYFVLPGLRIIPNL